MWGRALLVAAATAALAGVQAQLPIPVKPPGFVYGKGSAAAGVQLETYIDLLCPDSKAAFPALTQLVEHYQPDEFRLQFVLFPLPYHQHAFAAAEATFTLAAALGEASFPVWLETMYNNQELFYNKPTKDLTPVQVADKYFALAKQTFPALSREHWDKGMNGHGGTFADDAARVAWKYACSRGKTGTPLYSLNGVPFEAEPTWTLDDWRQVIDPLVDANRQAAAAAAVQQVALFKPHGGHAVALGHAMAAPLRTPDRRVVHFAKHSDAAALASVCASAATASSGSGHRACEFLPRRAMCCQPDEACVLRTGCVKI